jgi:hypothetical protein
MNTYKLLWNCQSITDTFRGNFSVLENLSSQEILTKKMLGYYVGNNHNNMGLSFTESSNPFVVNDFERFLSNLKNNNSTNFYFETSDGYEGFVYNDKTNEFQFILETYQSNLYFTLKMNDNMRIQFANTFILFLNDVRSFLNAQKCPSKKQHK